MNFIAGLLLITFSEETAFWSLTVILEDKLPKDYYNYRLLGAHIDIAVLMELLRERVPAVHEMFKTFNIDISVVCVSWFLCIFLNTLPIEVANSFIFLRSLYFLSFRSDFFLFF